MIIALATFGLESSTFTPLLATSKELFIRRENFASANFLSFCEGEGLEVKQVLHVSGSPSGRIEDASFEQLRDELIQRLKSAWPFDGLVLSMHGSMLREDLSHGELEILRAVRGTFGPKLPISVRLDLHGNIPDGFVDLADCYTALRTAPHRDSPETLRRAVLLLKRIISQKLSPQTKLVRIPLLFTGEMVITETEPAKSLYAMIEEVEKAPEILSASVMVGFAWADVPFAGASVIVTAQNSELAQHTAQKLADEFWRLRREFRLDGACCKPDELPSFVRNSSKFPIFASDSGDNITAGATGDNIELLRVILDAGVEDIFYAQFYDPDVVQQCIAAGEGARIEVHLGGKVGRSQPKPLLLSGLVERVHAFEHGTVVVFAIGRNQILIEDQRVPFPMGDLKIFEDLGIDLMAKNLCVFKFGYLMPELRDIAPVSVMVLNPGPTALDISSFTYTKVRRPIFPLDDI